ncbi:MAG: hypothetical protein M1541_12755, partial [Acidobacteria bacterium]|nr:hypothetical protein [Acidobacteriota bacterium]
MRSALLIVAAGLLSISARAAALENARLRVTLDAGFPRVLRYEFKSTGAVFGGGAAGAANTVEINGAPFTGL